MPINQKHSEYDLMVERWILVAAVITNTLKPYLVSPDIEDEGRSEQYYSDAILVNWTLMTLQQWSGAAFSKPPKVLDLPASIDYLKDTPTSSDLTLINLAQQLLSEILTTGRTGTLTEFSKEDDTARLCMYNAASIIDWNEVVTCSKTSLNYVKLLELITVQDADDEFNHISQEQYRILKLTDNDIEFPDGAVVPKGAYMQLLYNQAGDLIESIVPTKRDGSYWFKIPFQFTGASNNNAAVDNIPLYDLAMLNLGSYKNSADNEESIHIVGQPTYIMHSNQSNEVLAAANGGSIKVGARRLLNVGEQGDVTLLQPNPNQLTDVAMQRKEDQARMLGAPIQDPKTNETATAARMRHAQQTAVLNLIVRNVQDSLKLSLKDAVEYMSLNPEADNKAIELELNKDFFDIAPDANVITAQQGLYDRGIIAKADFRKQLRNDGLISNDRTDEEINQDVEREPPLPEDGDE